MAALERWPDGGIPDNPGAWLMAAAKHKAVDWIRRQAMADRKLEQFGQTLETTAPSIDPDAIAEDEIGDDLLSLIFTACHPVLSSDARAALTLRVVGGLSTEEIARAFLVPVSTIAQRIARAKRTLAEARVPFEVPTGPGRVARLGSVLEVVYLIFNEGYSATSGADWVRPALCEDALRLGRILAGLVPGEAEVHGLVALMEIQASRLGARVGPDGEPIVLLEQDRTRWDYLLIRRGLAALQRAERMGPLGPYALQAAIAACHVRAPDAAETDWARMVALYDALASVAPSPIVELNRGVAVGMAYGPAPGLEVIDPLLTEPALRSYYLLPSVRGDLLRKLGRLTEAVDEFERAASLALNEPERRLLQRRAAECAAGAAASRDRS